MGYLITPRDSPERINTFLLTTKTLAPLLRNPVSRQRGEELSSFAFLLFEANRWPAVSLLFLVAPSVFGGLWWPRM